MECPLSNENYVDVYRVEKRGRGPYNHTSGYFMEWSLPTPDKDGGLPYMIEEEVWKYRFGCPCPESMKEWIVKPKELDKLGYKVSLYKAKKKYVHSSEIQSMFIKRHAKKIKEWEIVEFMKGEKKTNA